MGDKTTEKIFSIWTCSVLLKGDGNALFICQHWQRSACQWYLLQLNLLGSDRSRCTLACQTLVRPHHAAYRSTSKGEKPWVCRAEGEWGKHNPNWGASLQSQLVWLYSTGIFLPASLINEALSRCWRVQLPGEAEEGHWWVLIEKKILNNYSYVFGMFCLPQHWVTQLKAHGYSHKAFFKRKQISL